MSKLLLIRNHLKNAEPRFVLKEKWIPAPRVRGDRLRGNDSGVRGWQVKKITPCGAGGCYEAIRQGL